MKTVFRRLLHRTALAVVLTSAFNAFAFYDTTIGRWASRDPIGEEGGMNMYSFVSADPVNKVDAFGLSTVTYQSEGRYYFDGNYLRSMHSGEESGKQNATEAWYWLEASEIFACPSGICNSGGSRLEVSSFVVASIKNTSKCKLAVSCHCNILFSVSNWAPQKTRGVLVNGHVLNRTFSHSYIQKPNPYPIHSIWKAYLAEGFGNEENWLSFFLNPGETRELYHGYDQNSSAGGVSGAGFSEYMKGACSCEIKN